MVPLPPLTELNGLGLVVVGGSAAINIYKIDYPMLFRSVQISSSLGTGVRFSTSIAGRLN